METFKAIAGYEGVYEASDHGNVRSLPRKGLTKSGNRVQPRILKCDVNRAGYCRVTLCRDGKTKRLLVHRIIAEVFGLANPLDKPQINHIDHDPKNNRLDNLEWATGSENMLHSSLVGRQDECRRLGMEAAKKIALLAAESKYSKLLGGAYISTQSDRLDSGHYRRTVTFRCRDCCEVHTQTLASQAIKRATALCGICAYKKNKMKI